MAASYFFYGYWKVEFLGLIAFSTLVDYGMGLLMGRASTKQQRLPFLLISLVSNFGLLGLFKYADFLTGSLNTVAGTHIPALELLLPVGISFYTFQTLSYSVDVYKGAIKPEKHLGYFALYVTFFPQLVAGPIERYTSLGPQLRTHHAFSYDNLAAGFRLILLGFFAKVVIADNLAGIVEQFYKDPLHFGRRDALMAIVAYSFQIYGDFMGYSLIAIGAARLLGIRLMDNFKTPYLSASVAEFWQRWHISLSTWFRDYLFIPIGGSRVGLGRLVFNIMVIFTVSGLWHGARWTFVIWGAIWGLFYLIEKGLEGLVGLKKVKPWSIMHFVRAGFIFLVATLAWIPFRSRSLAEMKTVFEALLFQHPDITHIHPGWVTNGLFLLFILTEFWLYNKDINTAFTKIPSPIRWAMYAVLIFCITALGAVEDVPFIYFQF